MILEHGDLIELPDGRLLIFGKFHRYYALHNLNGYSPCEGSLDDIYRYLPDGCKVIGKNVPYAWRKIKPYIVIKDNVQLTLF